MDSVVFTPVIPISAVPAAPGDAETATAALTRAMRAGDETAWREFHAVYAPRLHRYLLVVCRGNEELANEALQQTFLRAVKHLRIRTTEPELWSWLTVLARCAAADVGRRERRYLGFLERWFRLQPKIPPAPPGPDPESHLEAALAAELASMPTDERQLLERKYFAGDPVRQIAASSGVTEKAVESRLTRARQKLKAGILARLKNEHPT